jgi:molybdopterin-containing oxidoreductase family membrane subunit
VSGKQLIDRSVYELIGKVSGGLLSLYVVLKTMDTLNWAMNTAPSFGFKLTDFYQGPYGMWLLVMELGICGLLPAVLLMIPQARRNNLLLFGAFALTCVGVVINRFVMTVQAIAIPVMPFDKLQVYVPTMYEWAPAAAMLAYCALIISLSYRYLPIFPQERSLNP